MSVNIRVTGMRGMDQWKDRGQSVGGGIWTCLDFYRLYTFAVEALY